MERKAQPERQQERRSVLKTFIIRALKEAIYRRGWHGNIWEHMNHWPENSEVILKGGRSFRLSDNVDQETYSRCRIIVRKIIPILLDSDVENTFRILVKTSIVKDKFYSDMMVDHSLYLMLKFIKKTIEHGFKTEFINDYSHQISGSLGHPDDLATIHIIVGILYNSLMKFTEEISVMLMNF